MVTEQPQYSVVVCIFSTSQNTEISLIPNGLRLIYTCSLLLALPCIFHCTRHSFATVLKRGGAKTSYISESLGHSNLTVTENYLACFEKEERIRNARLLTNFDNKM
ncbi:tyrosine-type recombinase/integrase [Bacteroides thetaiotaomicron]|nr:tyrosine-type recombinase/integrase [Bacteroides thetaiotaomicron]MCA6042994.1 tyrosine-type recombinase/integrase [Bacteroides thetaiotaomicron]